MTQSDFFFMSLSMSYGASFYFLYTFLSEFTLRIWGCNKFSWKKLICSAAFKLTIYPVKYERNNSNIGMKRSKRLKRGSF